MANMGQSHFTWINDCEADPTCWVAGKQSTRARLGGKWVVSERYRQGRNMNLGETLQNFAPAR